MPFYLRAGKRLATTTTEVFVALKRPPQQVFEDEGMGAPNYLRFRLGPNHVSIAVGALAKKPGVEMRGREVELFVCNAGEHEMGAYERLIGAALDGDPSLFAREDGVLEEWRIVDPVIGRASTARPYEPGQLGAERRPTHHRAARRRVAPPSANEPRPRSWCLPDRPGRRRARRARLLAEWLAKRPTRGARDART